eukprot:scaffold2706_cov109-Isochrysis_galbana.AAC.1
MHFIAACVGVVRCGSRYFAVYFAVECFERCLLSLSACGAVAPGRIASSVRGERLSLAPPSPLAWSV